MSTSVVYKDDAGERHTLRFDGVLSESSTDESEVTEYTIEDGSPVTDHIRDLNGEVTLQVIMTNTPMHGESYVTGEKIGSVNTIQLDIPKFTPPFSPTPGGALNAVKGAASDVLGFADRPVMASVLMFRKDHNFIAEMLEALREVKRMRYQCSIITAISDYEGMVLKSISPSRSSGEDTAVFDLTFKKINVVTTKKVAAPRPAEPRGKGKKNGGVKDPIDTAAQKANRQTFAKALLGGALG